MKEEDEKDAKDSDDEKEALNDSMTLHISQLFIRSISVPRFVLPVSPNHLVATFAFNEP